MVRKCCRRSWQVTVSSRFIQVAVSVAVGSLSRAMKCAALENLSITVNKVVLSGGTGKPVTKSKEMCDEGRWGMVRGCNRPAGRCVFDLMWAQTGQAATYSLTSLSMVSQQKYLFMSEQVAAAPRVAGKRLQFRRGSIEEHWHLLGLGNCSKKNPEAQVQRSLSGEFQVLTTRQENKVKHTHYEMINKSNMRP